MWKQFNNNPVSRVVGDCAVRAISVALGISWEKAYALMASAGFAMGDMPSSNGVWGAVLRQNGFQRKAIENECPDCYTAEDFCKDHPKGTFVLGFGNHTCCIIDGTIFDSWNSSAEVPQYYWFKPEEEEK